MFKYAVFYMLLTLSIVFPPLLLVVIPLGLYTMAKVARRRRAILDLVDGLEQERRTEAVVRYFR